MTAALAGGSRCKCRAKTGTLKQQRRLGVNLRAGGTAPHLPERAVCLSFPSRRPPSHLRLSPSLPLPSASCFRRHQPTWTAASLPTTYLPDHHRRSKSEPLSAVRCRCLLVGASRIRFRQELNSEQFLHITNPLHREIPTHVILLRPPPPSDHHLTTAS